MPCIETNGVKELAVRDFYAVKSPVFPFNKFRGVDTILGPEMRSTGEVMGISSTFGLAFAKAQLAAGQRLPQGIVFISVNDHDKRHIAGLVQGSARGGTENHRHARHGRGPHPRRESKSSPFTK